MENKSAAVGCALRPFANGSEHVRVCARRRPTAVPRAYDIPPPQSHLRSLTHSHTHTLRHTHAHTCAQTLVHGLTRFAALAPSFAVCTLETVLFPVPPAAASSTEGAAPNRANGRPTDPLGPQGARADSACHERWRRLGRWQSRLAGPFMHAGVMRTDRTALRHARRALGSAGGRAEGDAADQGIPTWADVVRSFVRSRSDSLRVRCVAGVGPVG